MSSRRRLLLFVLIVGVAVAATSAYVAWAAFHSESPTVTRPANESAVQRATADKPFLVYQHVARDDHYAEIAVAPVDSPRSAVTFTGLVCGRVYYAAGKGLCLLSAQDALGPSVDARTFGRDFKPTAKARMAGLISRARVSPNGRYGAATTFVTGHSYLDDGFSTVTELIDMQTGKPVVNLEKFEVTRDGEPFKAIDFNFWGVTFTRDERKFYATLATGGKQYLVEGDIPTRRARVIHERVECPSLSPDETRIAYKQRNGDQWRLHVLDLASGQETALAETRSVDDQVEWLDDDRIIYGLEGDVWVVPADGSGKPEVYIPDALSPAVVRS